MIRNSKLAAVLSLLALESHRRLGRTKLQKLVYLADVQAFEEIGHTITGTPYVAYDHGPWQRELYEALEAAPGLRERVVNTWKGTRFEYSAISAEAEQARIELSEDEQRIIREVARKWSARPLSQILDHVYSTPPYRGTPFGEEVRFEQVAS